jgi:hypothetical protein
MLSNFGQIRLAQSDTVKRVGVINAMTIFLKAGARGWIETQVKGVSIIIFGEDTTVEVEPCWMYWYRTKGQVANLPDGHPPILINEIHLSKETT